MSIKGTLKTLGIVGVGAGIGAAAALLYAPQSGRRTRRDLRRFGARQMDRVCDLGEEITGYMGDRMEPVVRGSQWLRQKISRAS
ncbi:MAG TPA: YtxH domain-containing protein [Terriglobia bacterium]|nr:YtxH domain-containing protein [Terriglobia bacterium]